VTIQDRRAARVLLVDREDRLLLLRAGDPAQPELRYWFTPGGGLDAGESSAQGAARELFEETGLRVDPAELGEPVWHQVTEFTYNRQWYRQEQEFYLLRVPRWEVDTAGFAADGILAHRWWTVTELEGATELVYPEDLARLLRLCTAVPVPEKGL
jgi:8-oxo-dGTP pyrophosphatase MutT (NUDIX family)